MSLNIEVLPRIPARVFGENGITVAKSNGALTLGFDYDNSGFGAELQQAVSVSTANATQTDSDKTAADASATAAAASAAAAADSAASLNLPALTANTIMVDNSGGTAREAKTFAEVRSLLQAPSFAELPYIVASEHGVAGDASDQTSALQSIIDGLPSEGGNILLPTGIIYVTNVDLTTKHNVRILGQSGTGSGAGQPTNIYTAAGAGAGTMFDLRDTVNVSFENVYVLATSTSHDGTLFDYGVITGGSANMSLKDCYMQSRGSTAVVLSLYGSTTGKFDRIHFGGPATHLKLQNVGGVGYCNVHTFHSCNFNPVSQYPVLGGGDALSFIACNWQAGSADGIARGINTGTSYNLRGLTVIGCGFYDTLTAGGQWISVPLGSGVTVAGCVLGGAASGSDYGIALGGTSNADPELGGVRGVAIYGNTFLDLTAAIAFSGNNTDKSNVRGGWAGGNRVVLGSMYSNISTVKDWVNLPNHVYDTQNDTGSHFGLFGIPTASTGLVAGQIYDNSGVLTRVQ